MRLLAKAKEVLGVALSSARVTLPACSCRHGTYTTSPGHRMASEVAARRDHVKPQKVWALAKKLELS